jgi:hypothetical protein
MVDPPSVPEERLAAWHQRSDTTETPFSALGLTVSARILLYEDARLRETIRAGTGVDRTWRFYLASRLRLSPSPPMTRALEDLVASRANRGFVDRLTEQGFVAVERVDRRSLRIGGEEARLFQYDARCRIEDLTLAVDGWLAVWAPDADFRLAGGAYPTGVAERPDDGGVAATLDEQFDPQTFRSELFELIRDTR